MSVRGVFLLKDWHLSIGIFTDQPQEESPVLVVLMNSATFGNNAFLHVFQNDVHRFQIPDTQCSTLDICFLPVYQSIAGQLKNSGGRHDINKGNILKLRRPYFQSYDSDMRALWLYIEICL